METNPAAHQGQYEPRPLPFCSNTLSMLPSVLMLPLGGMMAVGPDHNYHILIHVRDRTRNMGNVFHTWPPLLVKPEISGSGASPSILALGGLRYEDDEFEGSLVYVVRYSDRKKQPMPIPITAAKRSQKMPRSNFFPMFD